MKGSPAVIANLQSAAAMEASLSAQYELDKRDLKYRGLKTVGRRLDEIGQCCDSYLRSINDRIFYLGGSPAYAIASVSTAETVTAIFQRALDAENAIVSAYNDWAIVAMEAKDDNTRNKFEHWIKWHEDDHIDWLERQLAQIVSMTEPEYIKIQLAKG